MSGHLNLWSGIRAWDESGRRRITNIRKLGWVGLLNILKEVCLERERKEGGWEGGKETHSKIIKLRSQKEEKKQDQKAEPP